MAITEKHLKIILFVVVIFMICIIIFKYQTIELFDNEYLYCFERLPHRYRYNDWSFYRDYQRNYLDKTGQTT